VSRRILHITDSLERTGLASQVLLLSNGLMKRGFDVHVASLSDSREMSDEFRADHVSTTPLGRRWLLDPVALWKLRRLMRRLRPDVVHAWTSDAAIFGRAAAGSAGASKWIIGQHRIDPWRGSAARLIGRRIAERASQLVTSSARIRELWANRDGMPIEKITLIPPAVHALRASDVSRGELLRELHLPAEARLIGVVGRLVPEKRVKDLIWAADLLRVLHDDLRLLVIGDGPLRVQLEQYARLASDLDHIRFLGKRSDVWRIMPHLDVLWNASENRAQSIANLEAMAAGVPVLASDTPINREMVAEGETGYLISLVERSGRADRARHTDHIFNSRELAAQLGEKARRRAAEHFSAERMLEAYSHLYATVP